MTSTSSTNMANVVQLSVGLNALNVKGRPRQNWVLDPFQDTLFIIVAPLLVLALALLAFKRYGAVEATSLIIVAHIVMTVAHHLPTFIRIYGDVDLFKRFKWNFVLGPVIPLVFSVAMLAYINANDYPVEYFLYLYILLALWDPWHFLRQHYGFMRIYDRPNAAPRALAARMDLWLSVAWFAYIMLASGAWLPGTLQDMYVSANIPIALSITADGIAIAAKVMRSVAIAMTLAYAVYLIWCWKKRYFISLAKLALLAVTFGVMALSYTPNDWMQQLAPGWTFKVGFAAVGIVHMTQYLAIVWRYNRSLAASEQRSRVGFFRRWHAKGGWLVGAGYVVLCLFYGEIVTTRHDNRLLMSVLLAVGFTSTLMHYYFDGFIWKVRHRQNREALAMGDESAIQTSTESKSSNSTEKSWWHAASSSSPGKMLARQMLYFGVPMTLLTVGALAAWQSPVQNSANYIQHMYGAQSFAQKGQQAQAEREARQAYASMNAQLPFTKKMTELQPTASREAELAFLIYNQSLYEHLVMPQLSGSSSNAHGDAHRTNVGQAVTLLSRGLERGDEITHSGRERMSRDDARAVLASWRKQVQ